MPIGTNGVFNVADIDGENGFVLAGHQVHGFAGSSVASAGDFNGDGINDILIGAPDVHANQGDPRFVGETYVVFGSAQNFPLLSSLGELNGETGFVIQGARRDDFSGRSVHAAGDINDDGIGDIIIGAPYANRIGFGSRDEGRAYVVLGSDVVDFGSSRNLSEFGNESSPPFIGIPIEGDTEDGMLGSSVSSAGDINGDGIDDFVVGAPYAGDGFSGSDNAGRVYVFFGGPDVTRNFAGSVDAGRLKFDDGFVVDGVARPGIAGVSLTGASVASAGDFNGDGIGDLIIGAPGGVHTFGNGYTGDAYIIFGSGNRFPDRFSLENINGNNGVKLAGSAVGGGFGLSVSGAGDVNGDGFADVIVGAPNEGDFGKIYVVFGGDRDFPDSIDVSTLDGTNGFVIEGTAENQFLGSAVSSAGDINDDGFDDVLIGGSISNSAYVIFGAQGMGSRGFFDLNELNGRNGVVIQGDGDSLGSSVSDLGDVNGDGVDDLIIGASLASPDGVTAAGAAYIIYGFSAPKVLLEDSIFSVQQGTTSAITSFIDQSSTVSDIQGDDEWNGGTLVIQLSSGFSAGITISLSDLDGDAIEITVSGTTVFSNGVDVGEVSATGGVVTGNEELTITFNANATNEIVQEVLQSVTVFLASAVTVGVESEVIVTATDKNGDTTSDTRVISITPGANDQLLGTANSDTIDGADGNDTINGAPGNDALFGSGGSDLLEGGAGSDTINGGNGIDTASYENSADAVVIQLATLAGFGGDAEGDRLISIENVVGSGFADNIRGNLSANKLEGGSGDDTLDGANGNDRLLGGGDNDMLSGGDGADTLVGGAGNDTAEGGTGNDIFFAGSGDAGDDLYAGGAGNDVIAVGDGDDLAVGDSAVSAGMNDTTTGADGSDTIFGGAGADTLLGGGWDDANNNSRFDGGEQQQAGSSSNVLYGGSGSDVVFGDGGADTLGGGLGSDTLTGGAGDDLLYGGKGATYADDVFSGGQGNDIFFGGSGNDVITGDQDNDELFGGAGNDTLNGGEGADSLFGGGGDDRIITGEGADALFFAGGHGDDVVTDFDAGADTLFLANTVTDFTDLASVQAAATETTVGGISGLLIDTGDGNSVFLHGLTSSDLTTANLAL